MYVHSTNKKINKQIVNKKQKTYFKPNGIWYAKNNEWIKWAKKNIDQTYKYNYKITILHTDLQHPTKSKILLINTKRELVDFTIKYGTLVNLEIDDMILINWKKVANDYGGIEVKKMSSSVSKKLIDYFNIKNNCFLWNYSFDITSGCVWNFNAVKSFEII